MEKKSIRAIFIIYCVTFIITVLTVVLSVSDRENLQEINGNDYQDLSQAWLESDGSAAHLSDISGEYIIHTVLPDVREEDVLYFNIKSANVEVYLDEDCIYRTQLYNPSFFGLTMGCDFVSIPLEADYSGRVLTMKLDNPYNDGCGKLTQISMGNEADMVLSNANSKVGGFAISIIITFIGLLFIVAFVPLWKQKIIGVEMLYFGLFAFGIGMFMLTDCNYPQIVSQNAHVYHMIAELFMMLFVIPMMLFFNAMYKEYIVNTKIMLGVCLFCLVDFAISYSLAICGIKDLHQTVTLTHSTYLVGIVVLLILLVRNIVRYRKETRFHMWAIVCISVGAVLDIVLWRYAAVTDTTFCTRLGALAFMCCEAAQIIWKILITYQKGIKAQLLEKLAYQDGLTELLNRTSFMEEIEKLQAEPHAKVFVAIYDVNNLKTVNDTMGHNWGDEMLTIVADAIREHFESIGKCYRIGGDEFALISVASDSAERYQQAYIEFTAYLENLNATKKLPFEVVVAAGCASTDTVAPQSIENAINIADSRMYVNKKELKAKGNKLNRIS